MRREAIDVALLADSDLGMVGSGNRNTVDDPAALGAGQVFAAATLETGPASTGRLPSSGSRTDLGGLRGNAVLTRHWLRHLAMLQLADTGRDDPPWVVGGDVALFARIECGTRPVTLVCTRFGT